MLKLLKINKYLIAAVILLAVFIPSAEAANLGDAFKQPLNDVAGSTGAGYRSDADPAVLIGKVIQAALSFVGVVFLILMIYAGYTWMLARGNDQQVEKAKNLITAAVIGLIIVLAAYAISYFVLSQIGAETMQEV
ncbi:hypothetical protein A2303_06765 [Candidatus Falkowbacteria bacterium RIFOXYB2_FULL_47_14]|uniref:Uncharacterized protein n=1 Tax=Candidatus Falkowbacteria bacterium RIFOXYA2_FULL_47_19 TaxID=1797994 RepID=A0A1F5SG84_9BACT|nr:MAG: hypothetical protein A2227_00510 [Candidatus Falkowbacteria bacterium RIFOXYA2_FULL_47_19]OGF35519.1 MAG: hypothetical protein A2468_05760 [Candidatus Falkowbacteria bacterium RIFOXYC2_FULL_46_15]OGF43571.1 MAG: hypothetical protein A2303_06765 [Candidatus Falkowbacteria bacterium RIFOXYB2_FULL_47_14]